MARTIDEIHQSMLNAIAADTVLSTVATSTSKVSVFRLITRIVASAIWTVEVLFDTLKQEINELLAKLKPHTLKWYASKAKAFQYGFTLPADTDVYDNSGYTEDQIDASLIVKYVAVTEQEKNLRIKVATENEDLEPLTAPQQVAFTEYMKRVKDAGVKLQIDSLPADKLRLSLKIFFDPLLINADGQRIDGTQLTPVQDAVKKYLKNLPFNGSFVLAFLIDTLQKIDGVVIPHVVTASATYGSLPFTTIDVAYLPDAGYLRFETDADLIIEFVAQSPFS